MPQTAVKYAGSTPGANSNDYILFDTTTAAPMARFFALAGVKRFVLDLVNDQAGTLKAYFSNDRGTTWNQYAATTVGIPTANTTNGPWDYFVEEYDDWKLVWTNGGSAQTAWVVQMALTNDRAAAA